MATPNKSDARKGDPDSAVESQSENTSTSTGGEDESSTEDEGDDRHLHDDQKSRKLRTE